MELRFKSYDLFGLTALLLLLVSLPIPYTQTFDVHAFDTYYIISVRQIYQACIILTGFFWIVYRLTGGWLLSRILLWIHIIGTILPILFFAIIPISVDEIILPVRNDAAQETQWEYIKSLGVLYHAIELILFFLLIFQAFFLINIIGGVLRKKILIRK